MEETILRQPQIPNTTLHRAGLFNNNLYMAVIVARLSSQISKSFGNSLCLGFSMKIKNRRVKLKF